MTNNDNNNDNPPPRRNPITRFTEAGLQEKLETQFFAETEGRIDMLNGMSEAERRELLREILNYLISTDSMLLSQMERRRLIDRAYRNLFEFGPLRPLFDDPALTEIDIRNALEVFARSGFGELILTNVNFDDSSHLERVFRGILNQLGYDLSRDPFIETGLIVASRRIRLSLLALSPALPPQITIRVHPAEQLTLHQLVVEGMLDEQAATILRDHLAAGRGLMIAGDAGAGKTTLLGALLRELPSISIIAVERAAELALPERAQSLPAQREKTFAQQITAAVERKPAWLILDEVRFDESAEMWAAITAESKSALLWAFRGSSDPVRLRSAFGMAVRRAHAAIGQEFIHSGLVDRLPMVALLAREGREGRPRLTQIGKWEAVDGELATLRLHPLWTK